MDESPHTKICRACLTEEGEFQSVFIRDDSSGCEIHLAEMIMTYASVQITLGDGLPELICLPCAKKAVYLYLFKRRCEESDTLLREQLDKSPNDRMFNITEEQRLAAEALDLDAYTIDVVIKPEITGEGEEQFQSRGEEDRMDFMGRYHTLDDIPDSDLLEGKLPVVPKQKIPCPVCNKLFTRISHLNRHKKNHNMLKQYICHVCNKAFSRKDLLARHQMIHNGKAEERSPLPFDTALVGHHMMADNLIEVKSEEVVEELKCVQCDKTFFNRDEFDAHTSNHEVKPRTGTHLRCGECNKKFSKAAHLTRHMKIHAAIKQYMCEICNKGFARAEQLVNHKNAHLGIKPHVCSICNKGFNQVSNLKDHMRTHNGEKPFLCSICGKGFNQLGNLRQHTIRHSGIKAHLCSTCGKGFASKGELRAHLRKHTGARPFVCPVCNHGFTTSSSLTKHKRIHSGEKPYECDVCKMKFSRSGILARHKRTHTGEKPYVCKFCTKAFSQSNDLSSHLRIHTGEKPFICDSCGQAFRQSSALKTHKKTHVDRTQMELDRPKNFLPLHSSFINGLP